MSTQSLNSWSRSSADIPIKQISQNIWEVPQDYQPGMKVPARIYADEDLLAKMRTDRTIQQCVNVTHLTGIYKYAITMPDGHEGYGFPIGGVAATDYDEGLISPGGVGYDINCGVRLIRTNLTEDEVRPALSRLVDTIFNFIPSGLGSRGQIKLTSIELDKAVTDGLDWAVDKGYAWPEDPKTIEEEGCMERATGKYNIHLPDRELAACPSKSPEAEDYLPAMSAACNFAWVNRQMITHWARQAFEKVFAKSADSMDMRIVYDVCHNVAKIESHHIDGEATKVIVHRKGATRSFPPEHPDVPAQYRDVGQPVLIPGSMGTSSWVLIGTPKAMELSFGTTAHGAGRFMSRSAAKRKWRGADLKKLLESRGIVIRAASMEVLAEEAPDAYKDVDRVADVSDQLGIGKKVVRMTPIGVAKG